jgi:hypothetical protein
MPNGRTIVTLTAGPTVGEDQHDPAILGSGRNSPRGSFLLRSGSGIVHDPLVLSGGRGVRKVVSPSWAQYDARVYNIEREPDRFIAMLEGSQEAGLRDYVGRWMPTLGKFIGFLEGKRHRCDALLEIGRAHV